MKRPAFHLTFSIGTILLLLSGCATPSISPIGGTESSPGSPVYDQVIWDCITGDLVTPGLLIQPNLGCDSWEINRYERPFNAELQDEYYPDMDILSAELGSSAHWFYVRIAVFDVNQETEWLEGVYGLEFDLDLDGRGDVMIAAEILETDAPSIWRNVGIQVWKDTDNDVGNKLPMEPDPVIEANGYDELLVGDEPASDDAWVRATLGKPSFIEIAIKPHLIEDASMFKWWAWVDEGVANPTGYDYHDYFRRPEAGDVYQPAPFFPAKEIYSVDNTCAEIWGGPPSPDPSLCTNDPHISRTPTWKRTPPPIRTPWDNGSPTYEITRITATSVTPTRVTLTPYVPPTRVTATFTPTPTRGAPPSPTTERICHDPTGAPIPCED